MSKRTQQIADEIQRILSEVIQYELKDPRVGFATVTRAEVSADLQHVKVWVSVMGDEAQQDETLVALEHAKGFLRRQIAQQLNHLRFVPAIHFKLDTSLAYSERIAEVLRQTQAEDAARRQEGDGKTERQGDEETRE
jgi:ribosome-binding factor A